jgi:hypothetical protein
MAFGRRGRGSGYEACLTNSANFLLPKYIKLISRGVFLHVITYANAGL